MTPQEIAARLTAIHTVMVDRFGAQPWIEPDLSVHQSERVMIFIYGPRKRNGEAGETLHTALGYTFEEVLADADAFVAKLPSAVETKRRDFLKSLGALIEQGRAASIEVEFLNPLEASMKALASNALTHEATQ